jgi:glycosyltransferase involved in cell wall biosynthesis
MKSRKPRVLVTHPDARDLGGVAGFFKILEPFLSTDVSHFVNARRPGETGSFFSPFRLLFDYLRFTAILLKGEFDLIHLNPSLNRKGVLRDSVFLLIGKLIFRKKAIVFWHGWEVDYAEGLQGWRLSLFRWAFKRTDVTMVLAQDFKNTLLQWGFEDRQVVVETTAFEESLTAGFDVEQAIPRRFNGSFDVLFFARLVRTKGIYEALDAYALLAGKYPNMRLVIAGDGPEFETVKEQIEKAGLRGAVLLGYVKSQQKKELLERSAVLFLPSYTEGFPIAVVEAMALGLPVVTRTVGGIRDFFIQRMHGFTTESKDPVEFAGFISELYDNRDLYGEIARNNHMYADEHFAVPKVRMRLESLYNSIVGGTS